jgi:peptidoglycan-associated lipoprotein
MNFVRASFVLALVVVSACSNNNAGRWAADGADGADGANGYAQGSASDPASPAYFQQTVGDRVYFTVDQSAIDDSARVVLAAQADWLAQNPAYNVTIEGHADEQGTREYNLALGARRANAAREYLVSMGVSADRIQTVSYGKERPAELCSAESCYAMNRRAVSVINNANF